MHVRVDEPGHEVAPARVEPLAARVAAESRDPAVGDRDVDVEPLAGERGEDACALDHQVGLVVAASDVDQAAAADSLEHQRPPRTMSSGRIGHARERPSGRGAHRAHHRRRRRDRRRLADALAPVRRQRVAELEHLHAHGRHVQDGRDQVVGERRVPQTRARDEDLLHQREAESLRDPALDLALDGLRVERASDVLHRRDLDHPDEPELAVDVDDRSMGGVGEGHVRVALARLGIERAGRSMVVLEGLLDRRLAEQLGEADARRAVHAPHLAAGQLELAVAELRRRELEHAVADGVARELHRAAGHPGLARGRRRAGRADGGVRGHDDDALHAELGARDLTLDRHEALSDLGGRRVHLDLWLAGRRSRGGRGRSSSRRSPRRSRCS